MLRARSGWSGATPAIIVVEDDPAVRRPDISLAERLLGWGPTIELEEGLRLTLAAMGQELPVAR